MPVSDVRRKILTYLHDLPDDQSVGEADLATAIGLTPKQVNASLAAAKKRGEVEVLSDGSIRLSQKTRGQFRDGTPPSALLPDSFVVPLDILNRAISKVPAVKYALGIAGIAAAAAIAYLLLANLQNVTVWIIFGLVVVVCLILMVLLYIFAKLIEQGGPAVQLAGIVLMWFVLVLFMVVCSLLTTSTFFQWPKDIKELFSGFSEAEPGSSILDSPRKTPPKVMKEKVDQPKKGTRVPIN